MQGYQWAAANVAAARSVLSENAAGSVVAELGRRLARSAASTPGWAIVALPDRLGDEDLQRAAAGVLSLLGRPFYSIKQDGRLWIGGASSPERDAASFGGLGAQALHVDAPNVQRVPDYTSLLILRSDPAGGGASIVGDLQAALASLSDADRAVLRRPVFFEGQADGLLGVGDPLLPFPVLTDAADGGRPWIRWAGKLLGDSRNYDHLAVLQRFADALQLEARSVALERGQLLIADQQRIAHGRTALGPVSPDDAPRCLLQAKVSYEPDAPAQQAASVGAGDRDV
ncbi:TauD/TfdA family dioxygenase [Actinoplanes sp. TBRC 11911]|nr:TauD/TfdA family dioxygenase [Actinoplanes sp. TBRC 11911]